MDLKKNEKHNADKETALFYLQNAGLHIYGLHIHIDVKHDKQGGEKKKIVKIVINHSCFQNH